MTLPSRWTLFLLTLSLLVTVTPALGQSSDEESDFPSLDFGANIMQSGQWLVVDDNNPGAIEGEFSGFHQVRAGLNVTAQFSKRANALVMIEAEPNDFGQNGFSPAIDFAVLNLEVTDQLTLQTGTPVTGLINFRGFSDGPVVQGNPLIGNSPADMITAAHGIKLIGTFDTFGFDVTVNRSFAEDFTNTDYTGVNLIGKVRYTGAEVVKVGVGAATHTGEGVPPNSPVQDDRNGLVFANGDRENYNLKGGGATSSTHTHVNMPSGTIVQADAKVLPGDADGDVWLGYARDDEDAVGSAFNQALFGGLGLKYNLTDRVYAAGRFTYVGNVSSDAPDEHTAVSRAQIGLGLELYDRALLKVEGVRQVEGANSYGQIGNNWYGATAELSLNF